MRTAQELFDTIVNGLREQNAVSLSEDQFSCAYRGGNDRRCAVGHAMPDAAYNPKMEGKGLERLLESKLLPNDLQEEFATHKALLIRLQDIHDGVDPKRWERAFQDVASRYLLDYTSPQT